MRIVEKTERIFKNMRNMVEEKKSRNEKLSPFGDEAWNGDVKGLDLDNFVGIISERGLAIFFENVFSGLADTHFTRDPIGFHFVCNHHVGSKNIVSQ